MLRKDKPLTDREIYLLQALIVQKIDEIDRAVSDYIELGDDPPDFLLDSQLDYCILHDKLDQIK